LSEQEKVKIIKKDYESFYALRIKLQLVLAEKMKRIYAEEHIDTRLSIPTGDHAILKIAELGKQALKDQKLMTTLWGTLKNQTKIATLLKVNRSSVNRRCKEYNLI
jgi:hypothetical protein